MAVGGGPTEAAGPSPWFGQIAQPPNAVWALSGLPARLRLPTWTRLNPTRFT